MLGYEKEYQRGTRRPPHKRRKKKKLNRAAFVLLLMLMLVASIAAIIYFTKIGESKSKFSYDEKNSTIILDGELLTLDANQLKFESDDTNMEYKFYYNSDVKMDIHEHEVTDDNGFINLITFDPKKGVMTVTANIPLVFDAELNNADKKVYIKAKNPREKFDKIVIIDAGHGGKDIGANEGSIYEKDLNINIALKVYELFTNGDSGVKVYMTRVGDDSISLERRPEIGNAVGDLFVSIHNNTFEQPSANGTETLYKPQSQLSFDENPGRFNLSNRDLAEILQKSVSSALGTRDRGTVEREKLAVLNASQIPAALIEVGYMTNPDELQNLLSEEYCSKAAKAIYDGILQAFSVAVH